jgi:drug/metabolite transporter (DMT)-like permease
MTDVLLIVMAIIWGINYSAVKYGSVIFSPISFAWLRVVIAAATLMIVAVARRKPWPAWQDAVGLIGLGIFGNGVYQLLFVGGVSRTRVADAALIVASAPAFIAIISWLRGVEQVRQRAVIGILLSILGVGIVITGNSYVPQQRGTLLGITLVVCAVLLWSIFSVSLRQYTFRVNVIHVNAFTMLGGLLPMLFITPKVLSGSSWRTISSMGWAAALYSSVVSIGVAYLFWYRGVRVLGPTRASMYGNLQPIVAILVAWVVLHETPTVWQGAGASAIVGGILLTRA